ncbi:MAG: hypothetical protein GXY07_15300 [Candidatus Hydrogenedentes bacterium]|nr:hypothetical protein [Candidatus Hydrogenedentota bacterium]
MSVHRTKCIRIIAFIFLTTVAFAGSLIFAAKEIGNREQKIILSNLLRPLGTISHPIQLPLENNRSTIKTNSIETQVQGRDDGTKAIEISLKQGVETVWKRIVSTCTFPVAYSVFHTNDFKYIVCRLYTGARLESGPYYLNLLPRVEQAEGQPENHTYLSKWRITGPLLGGTYIGCAILDFTGNILDVDMNGYLSRQIDHGWFPDIRISDAQTELYIAYKKFPPISDNRGDPVCSGEYKISSTSPVYFVNIHQINQEEIIILVTFLDTLSYQDKQILSSQLNRIRFNQFEERGLAILCLDRNGNLKWHGLLAPIHDSSACTSAYSHFTLDGEILIYAAYNDNIFYSHNHEEPQKLPVVPPSLFFRSANIFASLTALSQSGRVVYSTKLAEGYLWDPVLLSLPNRQLYIGLEIGTFLQFNSVYGNASFTGNIGTQSHYILAVP